MKGNGAMRELTSKERFNSKSNSIPLKDVSGEIINIVAVGFGNNSDGEAVGYIIADDGVAYGTISKTAIGLLIDLADFQDDVVAIKVITNKSKSNRDYITLELV